MAAFLLYNQQVTINENEFIQHFHNIDIKSFAEFSLGSYKLLLFRKHFIEENNYCETDNYKVFVVGSFVYKNLNYTDSLKSLLSDYIKNAIDFSELIGIYTLIFFNQDKLKIDIVVDPMLSKNIYFDSSEFILSSHFLPLFRSRKSSYTINDLAVWESIITGSLIPPDTYAKQINKLAQSNVNRLNERVKNISVTRPKVQAESYTNKHQAEQKTNQLLEKYFSALVQLDQSYNSHIGLTGGFDSRLLLIKAKDKLINLNTNSFYRKGSLEYQLAKQIAESAHLEFRSHESEDYDEASYINPEKSLLYLDGQIRSQNFIDEPFSNPAYFTSLYQNHYIGFHGCGGEQYRNADRFSKPINLRTFIEKEWFRKQGTGFLYDGNLKEQLVTRVVDKIKQELNIQKDKIGLYDLKRFQNEIWNPANRLTRVNALNQSMFYFAPFTEAKQSFSAYALIPFLGRGNKFQIEMMQNTNSYLNSIMTTHGYSIQKGLTKFDLLKDYLSAFIPRKSLVKLYYMLKSTKNTAYKQVLPDKYDYLEKEVLLDNINKNKEVSGNLFALNQLLKIL